MTFEFRGVKAGMLACTGNPSGPSLYHLLEVLGKEKVLGRIAGALIQLG